MNTTAPEIDDLDTAELPQPKSARDHLALDDRQAANKRLLPSEKLFRRQRAAQAQGGEQL